MSTQPIHDRTYSTIMETAFAIARVGSIVGAVGVPLQTVIFKNVALRGGIAPVRKYIPELLGDVLSGKIKPGRVFDFDTDLSGIEEAYAAMDERHAIKSLLKVSEL